MSERHVLGPQVSGKNYTQNSLKYGRVLYNATSVKTFAHDPTAPDVKVCDHNVFKIFRCTDNLLNLAKQKE